jgi:hypothetical protein
VCDKVVTRVKFIHGLNQFNIIDSRREIMNISRKALRSMAVMVASLAAVFFVAGCLGTLPQVWKSPPYDIVHTTAVGFGQPITDTNADMAIYSGTTYIVFQGPDSNGTSQIWLKAVRDYASTSVAPLKQLTTGISPNCDPHIVSGNDGYLYIVYQGLGCAGLAQTTWMKVRASDLAVIGFPLVVSSLPQMQLLNHFNDQARIAHSDGYAYSEIVWVGRPTTQLTPTIFYNRITDAGVVGTPMTVSVGTGCQSTSIDQYAQHAPRIGNSRPAGGYMMIAWYGNRSGGDSAYWRQIYNGAPSFTTDCLAVSNPTPPGTDYDVELSVSQEDNQYDSYVAWTKNDGAHDNVYFTRVTITGTVCNFGHAPYPSSDSFNPRVAAGNSTNKWMHLAYEHVQFNSHIWYNNYYTYDCGVTPTSDNTLGDSNGVLTLTVSPWVSGHNGNLGVIAAEPNSTGPGAPAALALQANQITADQLTQLEESGALSKAEIDSIVQNGVVNTDQLAQVLRARSDRLVQRRLDAVANSAAATAGPLDGPASVAPSTPYNDHCAEDPTNDGCVQPAQSSAAQSPAAPNGGCFAPTDYVVVGWGDGTTNIDYATEIGASRIYRNSTCYSGALATTSIHRLRTPGYANGEWNAPTAALVQNGIGHVVWQGFAQHGCPFLCDYNDDDIFYEVTHIPSYLPLVLQNH